MVDYVKWLVYYKWWRVLGYDSSQDGEGLRKTYIRVHKTAQVGNPTIVSEILQYIRSRWFFDFEHSISCDSYRPGWNSEPRRWGQMLFWIVPSKLLPFLSLLVDRLGFPQSMRRSAMLSIVSKALSAVSQEYHRTRYSVVGPSPQTEDLFAIILIGRIFLLCIS